jgi:hypothetical protein
MFINMIYSTIEADQTCLLLLQADCLSAAIARRSSWAMICGAVSSTTGICSRSELFPRRQLRMNKSSVKIDLVKASGRS